MRRKVLIPTLAACIVLAIAAPAAPAKTHKAHAASLASVIGNLSGAVKALQKAVTNIQMVNQGQTASIHDVDVRVDTVVANVAALTAGVPAIVDGLAQLKAGLVAIQDTLNNASTGLVGLNSARPQFGTFTSTGVIVSGTGQAAGGSGPKANALGASTGKFVIDFGNDVSKRFLIGQGLPNSGSAGFVTVADCALVTGAITCQTVQGLGSADLNPNHVLIVFGTGGATAPTAGFTVAAFSG